jgi:hypothetical protein
MTFAVLCRHFPEIAGTLGYDELRPITEAVERGDFHTLSAAWTVMALKSYSALAKSGGVQAGIAELINGEAKQIAAPRAGVLTMKIAPAAGGVRFRLARNDAAPVPPSRTHAGWRSRAKFSTRRIKSPMWRKSARRCASA